MHFTLPLFTALFANTALGAVILGNAKYDFDGHTDTAWWLGGDNPCDYTFGGHGNPCAFNDGHITLRNGFSYRVVNCDNGQPFEIQNPDGSLNAEAKFQERVGLASCNNAQGHYTMTQSYVF